jgi:hypothetical protein
MIGGVMGKSARVWILITLVLAMMVFAGPGRCGSLDITAAPDNATSAMYTINDVYNRLNDGTAGTKRTGAFTEPSAGPASTGHTLTELYDLASQRSRPAKTGQTTSYATGDDGDLEKGVTWPTTRFTDNSNGTVKDNLTGLIWLKNANCFGTRSWSDAVSDANGLASGSCGLSDGSVAGAWRLPNRNELASLVDAGFYNPALSNDAGTAKWGTGTSSFTGVQSNVYWPSTTNAANTSSAWGVGFSGGVVNSYGKTLAYYVWPVRGGQ